jgi:hypothetical protein
MTAEQVAADAYASTLSYERGADQVLAEPKILSVEAVPGRDVPKDQFGCCEPPNAVRWIVHAQGTFFNEHGGPAGIRGFGPDGWFLFGDSADDGLIGFSFAQTPPDLQGDLVGDPASGCTWLVDDAGTRWHVEWSQGWKSDIGPDGDAELLTAHGMQAATAGSTVEVIGEEIPDAGDCAADKAFAATAVVYFSFGPLN